MDQKEKVHISSQKSQCCSFQRYLCYTANGFALHVRMLQHEKYTILKQRAHIVLNLFPVSIQGHKEDLNSMTFCAQFTFTVTGLIINLLVGRKCFFTTKLNVQQSFLLLNFMQSEKQYFLSCYQVCYLES